MARFLACKVHDAGLDVCGKSLLGSADFWVSKRLYHGVLSASVSLPLDLWMQMRTSLLQEILTCTWGFGASGYLIKALKVLFNSRKFGYPI
jgi:hypothetical protein